MSWRDGANIVVGRFRVNNIVFLSWRDGAKHFGACFVGHGAILNLDHGLVNTVERGSSTQEDTDDLYFGNMVGLWDCWYNLLRCGRTSNSSSCDAFPRSCKKNFLCAIRLSPRSSRCRIPCVWNISKIRNSCQ